MKVTKTECIFSYFLFHRGIKCCCFTLKLEGLSHEQEEWQKRCDVYCHFIWMRTIISYHGVCLTIYPCFSPIWTTVFYECSVFTETSIHCIWDENSYMRVTWRLNTIRNKHQQQKNNSTLICIYFTEPFVRKVTIQIYVSEHDWILCYLYGGTLNMQPTQRCM